MRLVRVLTLCAVCLSSGIVVADEAEASGPDLIFGPDISTLGLGAEAGARFNDFFTLRLAGSYFSYEFDDTLGGIAYDVDLNLQSAGAILDVHPFGGGFRLSAGLRWNGNSVDFSEVPIGTVQIGGQVFAASDIGRLDGDVDFEPIAPYVGLGYVAGFFDDRFLVGFDLGMLYQGTPDIDLRVSGSLASDPALNAELDREADQIEDDLEFLGFYPVIALSFIFRF